MDKTLKAEVEKVFAPDGCLAHVTEGYTPRQSQIEFSKAVADSLEKKQSLVVEAGTGTGKTFAYLVPCIIHGGKVLISTAGKTLQDQLFEKDVPAVLTALGVGAKIAVLKGRANYICLSRFEHAMVEKASTTREELAHLLEIKKFVQITKTGERSDITTVPESSGIWRAVTSTSENCIGKNCPDYENCFVMKAREKAREAAVLIINHHLFLADMELNDQDFVDFLPDFDMVIFDEAHQLPSIATSFFSESISMSEVKNFAQDAYVTAARLVPKGDEWKDYQTKIFNRCNDVRLKATILGAEEESKKSLDEFTDAFLMAEPIQKLALGLQGFIEALKKFAQDNEEITLAVKTGEEILEKLNYWEKALKETVEKDRKPDEFSIKWFNLTPKNVTFSDTKLSYADKFRQYRQEMDRPWILTSATLSVENDFHHFTDDMGLEDAETHSWESPFHYASQGMLYVPTDIPEPNAPYFSDEVAEKIWPLLQKNRGRAFVLCTTLRAVQKISDSLKVQAERANETIPILVQNDAPKNELIRQFKEHGNAILVGSMSFWEGVDIKGEALSMVIIDKIPFPPPDDPVIKGKTNWLKSQNKNHFRELFLPEAITLLKQGAGRLIRDRNDRGMLIICDKRLLTKSYGAMIWNSLPDFARTARLENALAFLEEMSLEKQDKIGEVKF